MRFSSGNLPLVWRFHVTYWARFYSSQTSCGSMLPQRARVIWLLLLHTEIICLFIHTPCLQPIQKWQEYMCHCAWKKSTEVPGQGKFHFVYFLPISKVYYVCLSVGYICKSNVLQNYLKNTNICLTPGKKKAASRNLDFQTDSAGTWASWNDCHLTTLQLPQTVSSLQPPVPPFHIMQPRMAKALP